MIRSEKYLRATRRTAWSANGTPEVKEAPAPRSTVGRASLLGLKIDASSRTLWMWDIGVPPLWNRVHGTMHEQPRIG